MYGDVSGVAFADNVVLKGKVADELSSMTREPFAMERAGNGLLYPSYPKLAKTGAPRDLSPVALQEVGPPWYPKPVQQPVFGASGQVTSSKPGDGALAAAIMTARDGDAIDIQAAGLNRTARLLAKGEFYTPGALWAR